MVFVEEKYSPQTSYGTPSSQMGAGTGLRELVLVVVRALSYSQIPSQYPIIVGVLVMRRIIGGITQGGNPVIIDKDIKIIFQ